MADLTAIILTRNEEDYIAACIESIKPVAKRIVVVDSFSDDKTVSIAQEAGAEVHQHGIVFCECEQLYKENTEYI